MPSPFAFSSIFRSYLSFLENSRRPSAIFRTRSMSMSVPSANWRALKRTLSTSTEESRSSKRRKINANAQATVDKHKIGSTREEFSTSGLRPPQVLDDSSITESSASHKVNGNPDSVENLAAMILRPSVGKDTARPTKFLALDCEMVGVGPYGLESALARVTLVNFVGDVVLDEFVLPQETVTDWRTAVSGIRKEDMANAKPFAEIQTRVAELLKDRYLVGHALKNDLDALLLSHPWLRTRDTQGFRVFKAMTRSQRPALRKLVKHVFDISIQQGEHSSIIDARATMALYRLYRKEWEGGSVVKEPIGLIHFTCRATDEDAVKASDESLSKPPSVDVHGASGRMNTSGSATSLGDADASGVKSFIATPSSKSRAKSTKISSGLSVVAMHKTKASKLKSRTNGDEEEGAFRRLRPSSGRRTSDGWWKVLGS